eukprot:COSAG05_NODE_2523_length_2946_cov_5.044335_4_plen_93_part_00
MTASSLRGSTHIALVSDPEIPATPARSDTLVLWHHGHSQPCSSDGCHVPWIDDQLDWLNELGYDAMVLQMPGMHAPHLTNANDCIPIFLTVS